MKIGELARAAGVPTSTVRYYERTGLLPRPMRTPSGYRDYDEGAVERLRFIRAAQGVGFALEDIRVLLQLDRDSACSQVRRILEQRLAHVERKLEQMYYVRDTLRKALERCRRARRACPVLEGLRSDGGRAAPGRSR